MYEGPWNAGDQTGDFHIWSLCSSPYNYVPSRPDFFFFCWWEKKLAGCPSVEHIQVITQLFPDIQSSDSRAKPIPGAKSAGKNRSKFSQETRNRDSDQPSCLLSSVFYRGSPWSLGARTCVDSSLDHLPVLRALHHCPSLCMSKRASFLTGWERTWFLCLGLGLPTTWQVELGVGMPCRQICAGLWLCEPLFTIGPTLSDLLLPALLA